jgi:4'-phosphopantetheinyl transferase
MFESLNISPTYKIHTAAVEYDRSDEMFHYLKGKKINMSHLDNVTNEKRKAEWMFIREIICRTMPHSEDIVYDLHRKPSFKNSANFLSISHSSERVAVAINEVHATGIDLQYITPKILRIKSKFLNEEEQSKITDDSIELTCYWCIKEALFKIYGKKDAFLKENFEVQNYSFDGSRGRAIGITRANGQETVQAMELRKLGKYMMAYSVNY